MSLPFANNPDKSSIYNDLKIKKLVDLTADDFDAFRARMDAQGVDGLEDEYRRLLLLGQASNKISSSGPLSNTGLIKKITRTSDGTDTVFQPEAGESWQFVAGSCSAVSEAVRFKFLLTDGTNDVELKDQSVLSNITDPVDLSTVPLYIDQSLYLKVNISSISTGSGIAQCAFVRVR